MTGIALLATSPCIVGMVGWANSADGGGSVDEQGAIPTVSRVPVGGTPAPNPIAPSCSLLYPAIPVGVCFSLWRPAAYCACFSASPILWVECDLGGGTCGRIGFSLGGGLSGGGQCGSRVGGGIA